MTDHDASLPAPPSPPAKSGSKLGLVLLILIIILSCAVGALGFYFWTALQHQETKISQGGDYKRVVEQRMDSLERTVARHSDAQQAQQQTTAKALRQLEEQTQYTARQLLELNASSRADWLLAEAEYLLRLANQRLNIERDVRGAEAILASADKVLAEVDDPGLLPVRLALAEEMFALQSVRGIDRDGLYARLDAAIARLQTLDDTSLLADRIAPDTPPEPQQGANDNAWQQFWRDLMGDLKQAFVIRRMDRPVEPLLAPEQSYYLRQNLRLMLEQASLALLEGKQDAYARNLEKADDWLNRYFEGSDARVASLREAIAFLQLQRIAQTLPDISTSLKLLKNKVEAMYRHHQLDKHTRVEEKTQESNP